MTTKASLIKKIDWYDIRIGCVNTELNADLLKLCPTLDTQQRIEKHVTAIKIRPDIVKVNLCYNNMQ